MHFETRPRPSELIAEDIGHIDRILTHTDQVEGVIDPDQGNTVTRNQAGECRRITARFSSTLGGNVVKVSTCDKGKKKSERKDGINGHSAASRGHQITFSVTSTSKKEGEEKPQPGRARGCWRTDRPSVCGVKNEMQLKGCRR